MALWADLCSAVRIVMHKLRAVKCYRREVSANIVRENRKNSGCGPAWSGRWFREPEIGGSNPLTPTLSVTEVAQFVVAVSDKERQNGPDFYRGAYLRRSA